MRAVIYCRVSTKEQTQNLSLKTQLSACREYCRREGFEVVRAFIEEGESAKTANRRRLQELLTFCKKNKGRVDCVVVYNLSRFSREAAVHYTLKGILQGCGVFLRSVMEAVDDSSTGRLIEGILASVAQFDNDAKAERTRAGMRTALERGRWTFKAPLGYRRGTRGGPSLIPDPGRSELIRMAFDEVASGHNTREVVRRHVSSLGLRTRRGKELSRRSFDALLRNRLYTGWIEVPRWGVSAQGDFQALIPDATFELVQGFPGRQHRKHRRHLHAHPDFPLKRFVRCGGCGAPLTGSWSRGRSKRYAYYHCAACGAVRVSTRDLECAFLDLLERLKPREEYLRLFNEIVRDVWRERAREGRQRRAALEARTDGLHARLDRLEETFIFRREIDRASYERQRDRLRREVEVVQLELAEVSVETLDLEGLLAFAGTVLRDARGLWVGASQEQRQRLQLALFPEGLHYARGEFGTAVTCLAFSQIGRADAADCGMVSPRGFEPLLPP